MITLKDIARASGVSTATVSYVINNGPREVSPATRERVLAAIKELNYRPNAAARWLKGKKTDTFGVVFPHVVTTPLDNSYFAPVLAGILDVSTDRHTACMLFTGLDWDAAEQNMPLYTDGRCDGLILIAVPKDSKLIQHLANISLPFVLVGTHLPDLEVSSVDVDNIRGAAIATGHLLDLGHRRVGMLQGSVRSSSNDERTRGFLLAHQQRGLIADESLITPGAYQEERAYAAARSVLGKPEYERPTALFCANDTLAVAALRAAHDFGICVPDELSVVGFDDYDYASQTTPPLTTMRQPLRDVGSRAANLLLDRVHKPDAPHLTILLETMFVERATTAPPSTNRGLVLS